MIFLYLIFRGMARHSPNFFLAVGMNGGVMRKLLLPKLDIQFLIVYIIAIIVVLWLFLAGVL